MSCTHNDWSVRVHYVAIKHETLTRILYQVIMDMAYGTGLSLSSFVDIFMRNIL